VGARRKNSFTPSSDRVELQSVQFSSNSINHLPTHYIVGIFPLTKCKVGYQELDILGYNITPYGILPAKSKADSIISLKKPKNLRALQSFLEAVNFFRKSIPNLAKIAKPLYNLCKKDVAFNFNDECVHAWEKLKSFLAIPPLLAHYRPDLPVEIHVDASYKGFGASLVQIIDNVRRPAAYASRKPLDREANIGSTTLEAAGVSWVLTNFKYFLNDNVGVYSDHHNLWYLFSKRDLTPQLMRIVARLQEFKYKVYYVKGTQHNFCQIAFHAT
jgi:RNase H-like domain found in reverse transcriptase